MARRRRADSDEVLARINQALNEVPPADPRMVASMREILLREVRNRGGHDRLSRKALASMVALLLQSPRG